MTVPELRSQVLLRSEQSGGHVSVIENVVAPRVKGPYLHKHNFDEAFYIIEGELVFQVDDQLVTARKGDLAFAPRNVAHTLTNRTDEPARYVHVHAGGAGALLRALGGAEQAETARASSHRPFLALFRAGLLERDRNGDRDSSCAARFCDRASARVPGRGDCDT